MEEPKVNEGEEPSTGDADVPGGDEPAAPRDRGPRSSKGKGRPSANDSWDDDWDGDWDDTGRVGGGLDLRLVGAIVAAVVLVVLVVLFTRDDKDSGKDEAEDPIESAEGGDGGLCGNWPAPFGGDGTNATVTDGVHLWSDFGGIHVRSNMDEPVTVKLTGDSDFTVTDPGTSAALSAQEGKKITVEFDASDGSDGPDFDLSCFVTVLTVEATGADGRLEPGQINIGGSSVATGNPYKLVRDPA